jgi:phosphotransferase system  glucose/maltose/N-acetylglucosamine-specific IIC component
MDANKYLTLFIGMVILVAVISATAGTLLTNVSGLNTTFADTGLGTLFSTTIFGVIIVAAIFVALWKGFHIKGKKR